jgi:hypothetical protein
MRNTSAFIKLSASSAAILALLFAPGCSCHNPVGPDEPTPKPTAVSTPAKTPTSVPTAASTPATPAPTFTSTATAIPTAVPTATPVPTSEHLHYVLTSNCYAQVYLYLPGIASPVNVSAYAPSTFDADEAVGYHPTTSVSWSFTPPLPGTLTYSIEIYIDGVLWYSHTN